MFFPTPLLEVIFRGTLRRSRPKSAIFDRFGIPAGLQNPPRSTTFGPKGAKRVTRQSPEASPKPTWARFGAENAHRTYLYRSGFVLVDFGKILEGFWKDFGPNWDECSNDFSLIFKTTFE